MFEVFDSPDPLAPCARRNRSTVAPQALILMNNSFVALHAKRFADRVEKESGGSPEKLISLAFEYAYARPPRQSEMERSARFLSSGKDALVDFCQALMNSNEFVYIP